MWWRNLQVVHQLDVRSLLWLHCTERTSTFLFDVLGSGKYCYAQLMFVINVYRFMLWCVEHETWFRVYVEIWSVRCGDLVDGVRYATTHSATQVIRRRIVGWQVNDELEKTWQDSPLTGMHGIRRFWNSSFCWNVWSPDGSVLSQFRVRTTLKRMNKIQHRRAWFLYGTVSNSKEINKYVRYSSRFIETRSDMCSAAHL